MNDPLQPTVASARIGSLDFLRGVAILGIVFINIENFAYADSWSPYKYGFNGSVDRATRLWVYFLTQGKFATMFTLLFGVGFYLFLERLDKKQMGLKAMDIYARRLLWLFIIGVAHAYLIWAGDVLYHYAVCGFLLFPFRSLSKKGLLMAALVLVALQANKAYDKTSQRRDSYASYLEVKDIGETERTELENRRVNYWNAFLDEKKPDTSTIQVPKANYLTGLTETYVAMKVHKGLLYYQGFLFPSLMVMLLGIYLYKSGIFTDYHIWKYYWLTTILLLVAGLFVNYLRYYHWTFTYNEPILSYWKDWAFTFNKELLGVGYALLLNGLYQKFLSSSSTSLISDIGRMALSNYLFQNIVMGFLFYGYGLSLFNRYSRSELLWLVVLVWSLQLVLTWLWSKRFKQGPVEWFWKKMTYQNVSVGK